MPEGWGDFANLFTTWIAPTSAGTAIAGAVDTTGNAVSAGVEAITPSSSTLSTVQTWATVAAILIGLFLVLALVHEVREV